jgi:osmotically-inducible protein OsmY
MSSSNVERHLRILTCSCLIACGLAGAALPATDQELVQRVEAALQSDPYFYEAHVSVSADNGSVVLSGMVFSDWDLNDALRIARRAAGGARVIDNLTIETGGRR